MAPPKQTYKTEEAAKASKNSLMKQLFTSKKKGRPKKADGDPAISAILPEEPTELVV
jgi:hypothetical protein